jgi:predicted Zn-dependent peptidase
MPQNVKPLFDIIIREVHHVLNGDLADADVQSAKQYAIGRYQRGAQTVGGPSNGYAYRYFFDDHIDDYYQLPNRIKAITKNRIVSAANSLFEDKVWGLGCLTNAGEPFVDKLYHQAQKLW